MISAETNHATEVPKSASCRVLLVRSGEVESNAGNGDCSMVKRRPLGGGVELRDVAELAIALLEHLVERERTKGSEVVAELLVDCGHSGGGIVLGAPGRLGEDIIDTAEELDVGRGVFESGGGVLLFAGVLPHDGGAAL